MIVGELDVRYGCLECSLVLVVELKFGRMWGDLGVVG